MDRRLELVDALLTLGKQCEKVAKLLSQEVVGAIRDDTLLTVIPETDLTVDVASYQQWPMAAAIVDYAEQARLHAPALDLADLTVLEYSIGPTYPVSVYHQDTTIDLISDDFKFTSQPQNVRFINWSEIRDSYDVGIAYETLEFTDDPPL